MIRQIAGKAIEPVNQDDVDLCLSFVGASTQSWRRTGRFAVRAESAGSRNC
jgi:hypothetical protein